MRNRQQKIWSVVPTSENNLPENELIFSLQNAMLLSLVERKAITQKQYDDAIERLKRKK